MTELSRSRKLFWMVCIPSRLLIAWLLFSGKFSELFKHALLLIGLAFLFLWVTKRRLQAPEADGQKTWWHDWRAVHGLLYIAAALLLWNGKPEAAGLVVAGDVLVGVLASSIHYAGPSGPDER